MRIDSRVAVVTGASSGIGAAVARQLADAGVRVGLTALPDRSLDDLTAAIRAKGGIAFAAPADVTEPVAVRSALHRLAEELGPIDLLVLNAGVSGMKLESRFSAEEFEHQIRVNLLGAAYGIDAVLPQMIERGRGHLVGISSLSALRGLPLLTSYCASKAALATLLEGLRAGLAAHGITVTTVRPGFVRTPLIADLPKPPRFLVDVETAARTILEGIAQRRHEVRFPWQSNLVMTAVHLLPNRVYDSLAPWVLKKVLENAARHQRERQGAKSREARGDA